MTLKNVNFYLAPELENLTSACLTWRWLSKLVVLWWNEKLFHQDEQISMYLLFPTLFFLYSNPEWCSGFFSFLFSSSLPLFSAPLHSPPPIRYRVPLWGCHALIAFLKKENIVYYGFKSNNHIPDPGCKPASADENIIWVVCCFKHSELLGTQKLQGVEWI